MLCTSYLLNYTDIDESYKKCVDIIMYLKGHRLYYIGATNNPEQRLLQHIEEKNMHNMYLLCRVPTQSKTKSLESKLIKRFDNRECINQAGGGEGITEGENYIYILFN